MFIVTSKEQTGGTGMVAKSVAYARMACVPIDEFDPPGMAEKPWSARNIIDSRWAGARPLRIAHRTLGTCCAFYHVDAGALVRRDPQSPPTMEVWS
jgi:hypothetical protein